MAERTYVTQVQQIGVEGAALPGTPVAARKRLQTLDFEVNPQVGMQEFRPAGQKFLSIDALNREWVQAAIRGAPTYTEFIYPLGSALNVPNPNPPAEILDGVTRTGGFKYIFEPSSTAPDSPLTFTIEQGSSVRAQRYSYAIVRELGFRFTRENTEITGQLIAQKLNDGVALTANPLSIPLTPILASQVDVFLDPTSATLGTTKLRRLFSGNFVINNRYGPLWVVDSAQASWAAHVETPATIQTTIIVEADAQGMGLLLHLRVGDTQFLRIRAVGPSIYVGGISVNYSLTFDVAVKVGNIGSYSDQQGIYAVEFRLDGVHDATWGRAIHCEVINTQRTL